MLAVAGCGSERDNQGAATQNAAGKKYTPPKNPPSPPEPTESPPLQEEPAAKVIEVGNAPEDVVADPETGLVAVGLRNPNELALVDGESREIVRKVELPKSARHLDLAAPGGPVLVPIEGNNSLVQVGLPGGEVLTRTPVGKFPHDAAAAPNGRIFVVNEFGDTVSVIANVLVEPGPRPPPLDGVL